MLGQGLLEFQPLELQQLDGLLQLRGHDELLAETQIEPEFHTVPFTPYARYKRKRSPR